MKLVKTLIFNCSPKVNGDTEALVYELASHLNGEVKIISSKKIRDQITLIPIIREYEL
jgi:hypothetical protein